MQVKLMVIRGKKFSEHLFDVPQPQEHNVESLITEFMGEMYSTATIKTEASGVVTDDD